MPTLSVRLILVSLVVSLCGAIGAPVPLPPSPPRPGADSGPSKVEIAAWFADITKIDSAAQSFTASLVLAVRWKDPSLAHADGGVKTYPISEVWHPPLIVTNEGTAIRRTLPETVNVAPDGEVVYRQRLIGSFQQPLNMRRFPFDKATFRVDLVTLGYPANEIDLQPDAAAVKAGLPQAVGHGEPLTMQDWNVRSVGARSHPYALTPDVELAGYQIDFFASRRPQYYLLKVILPLLLIVLMSWSVFWIDPTLGASQISVAVTSILTLIAYRFAIGAEVPRLPYPTLLDSFILLSTVLVFLSLVEVIATSALAANKQIDAARRLDGLARWVFPATFLVLVALCVLL